MSPVCELPKFRDEIEAAAAAEANPGLAARMRRGVAYFIGGPDSPEEDAYRRLSEIPREGTLVFYVPDGHLADGGVRKIWEATGIPYPGNDNYLVVVDREELVDGLGYPSNGVKRVAVAYVRPHDVPLTIKEEGGIGITGKDFCIDKLEIPFSNGNAGRFDDYLKDNGLIRLCDIACRPANLVWAFRREYGITTLDEAMEKIGLSGDQPLVIATEMQHIAEDSLRGAGIDNFRVKLTTGKTECYPRLGHAHGILDVAESGGSILANGLIAVRPEVMRHTTPQLIAGQRTVNEHPGFICEVTRRLEQGRDSLYDESPGMFDNKLRNDVFAGYTGEVTV